MGSVVLARKPWLFAAAIICQVLFASGFAEEAEVPHPAWFKRSFLDLPLDLAEAREGGKAGIVLYFHTPSCGYCKALLRTTFSNRVLAERLRSRFDVIPVDVLSDAEVTGLDGQSYWAKDFAVHEKAGFTPTLVFYGEGGKRLLRLVGYHPPKRFEQVLDYLEEQEYEQQSLHEFLSRRTDPETRAPQRRPVRDPLFSEPPYILDRRLGASERPLFVLFSRNGCDPCERFDRAILRDPVVRDLLGRFEAVRLDMNDGRTGVITPAGQRTTPGQWSEELELLHVPAMVFFDQRGREVIRVDSDLMVDPAGASVGDDPRVVDNIVARLRYVLTEGYLEQPQFQQWRARQQGDRPGRP